MGHQSRGHGRCGIVLAAGEGMRLRPFIRRLKGKDLPKQYINFIGTRSMLEHTFHRVGTPIPPDRLFTVVARDHLTYPEVCRQLSDRPEGRVILQPENKETGPGILLPLIHADKFYPGAGWRSSRRTTSSWRKACSWPTWTGRFGPWRRIRPG
jgi:mannose-1-phosphate guanylyltransferase